VFCFYPQSCQKFKNYFQEKEDEWERKKERDRERERGREREREREKRSWGGLAAFYHQPYSLEDLKNIKTSKANSSKDKCNDVFCVL
jgi:hypothetical protein